MRQVNQPITRTRIILSLLLCLALSFSAIGQTSPCTQLDSRRPSWPQDGTVYVNLGNLNEEQRQQIAVATGNWTQGNMQGGNNVNFSISSPPFSNSLRLNFTLGQNQPVAGVVHPAQMVNPTYDSNGNLTSATIRFDLSVQRTGPNGQPTQALNEATSSDIFTRAGQHEMGHTMGLGEGIEDPNHPTSGPCGASGQTPGSTVMNGLCGANDWGNNMPTFVTPCDLMRVQELPQYQPTPSPTPTPEPEPDCYPNCTPILVDVAGNGFALTSFENGVDFDLNNDGNKEHTSWTVKDTDDSWLVLDRDNNGTIDSGAELFGNSTPQPTPPSGKSKNGFLALAMYDRLLMGGNSNGVIDPQDAVFANLKLWRDANHNGTTDEGELSSLASVGLRVIELDYKESKKTDEHGNAFVYRAKVWDHRGQQAGRWAWDVGLVTQP